jgi:sugar-specific transcriptional regulator TrmB
MKKDDLIGVLNKIGLNENESKAYFAALSLGPTTILNIAKSANIKRTTVYSAVESLQQKGLMYLEVKGWKKLYVAENPEKLMSVLRQKQAEFKEVLPEFSALYKLENAGSFIKYYEGIEGVKTVYEELLKDIGPNEDYLVISDSEKWVNIDPDYFEKFLKRRAKLAESLKFKTRLMSQKSEYSEKLKKFARNYGMEVKLLPPQASLMTNLVVIPKRTVIHQLTPPVFAVTIENKSIIQMHREFFELIWSSIK